MPNSIALIGGEEFRPGCEDLDLSILAASNPERSRLLVLPTAAGKENPAMAAANGVRYFTELGADASPLMVIDRSDAEDTTMVAELGTADVVYLTGGNPAHLFHVLRGSALLHAVTSILERGAVLAGSSAGAMVLGAWMNFGGWRAALGVAGSIAMLPHHECTNPDAMAVDLADAPPKLEAIVGVDSRTGCLSTSSGWTVLGAGQVTVYQGGVLRRYGAGESFVL